MLAGEPPEAVFALFHTGEFGAHGEGKFVEEFEVETGRLREVV